MEIFQGEKTWQGDGQVLAPLFTQHSNLIASFKHSASTRGPMDNILLLKSKNHYDYIQDSYFLRQMLAKRWFCFKCYSMGQQVGLIWWGACNLVVNCIIVGWCLIMSSVFKNGPPWFVMFTTQCTAMCSPLQFATCNLNPQKLNVSCGQN
jgi:hypothetical protein